MRLLLAALLLLTSLAGCLADGPTDDPGDDPAPAATTPEVVSTDAVATVEWLRAFADAYPERRLNGEGHVGARDHLASAFEDLGLDVVRQSFTDGIDQENILGFQRGVVDDEWVVVGGHYDTYHNDCQAGDQAGACPGHAASSGIYDDGSGVALTYGLARELAGVVPERTVVWAHFDGEERGTQGSRAFLEAVTDGVFGDVTVVGYLDLDMIGLNWPGVDAPIYFHENDPALYDFAKERMAAFGAPDEAMKSATPKLSSSDFANFMALEIPTAYMVSDFQEVQAPGDVPLTTPDGAYPFWHTADTWDNMVLMAGNEQDVVDGFQVAQDLAGDVVLRLVRGA